MSLKFKVCTGLLALGVAAGTGFYFAQTVTASNIVATAAQLAKFDKGPATINVSKYPKKMQDYYHIFSRKCSQCHRLSRPINSTYVLPDEWARYIKRMMYKPGSNIGRSDAKKIYEFLVYDSSVRKKKELQAKLKTLTPKQRAKEEKKIKAVVAESK